MKDLCQASRVFVLRSAVITACLSAAAFGQTSPRPPARTPQTGPPPSAAAPRGPVAVVDISFIFKNHEGFKATMEQMKQEVQAYEEQLRTRGNALNKERDQLAEFRPGTPDYDNLERSLADKAAKLQVDMQLKKKEFLEREGKVYFQVYDEVAKTIREYAEMNQIDLVLRYSGDPIDPNDRQSVLQGVNRAIVYERNLDITREILDRLNRVRVSDQRRPARPPAEGTRSR